MFKDELSAQAPARLVQPAAQQQAEHASQPARTASVPAQLLALQRSYGNQAVQRLFAQRQGALGEEDESVQMQADGAALDEDESSMQMMADGSGPSASSDLGEEIRASAGQGSPLDVHTLQRLETGLGTDLSAVRVHTDSQADRLSRSVNAVAFTSGADIYFRQGAYSPGSSAGDHLLAHEASHVVQQAAGPVAGTPTESGVSVSDPGDAFERAADASAAHIAASATPVARQTDEHSV